MRLLALAFAAILLGPLALVDDAAAAEASKPVPVLGGPADDHSYSAVEGYRAWIHAPRGTYHLIVKPTGEKRYVVAKGDDVGAGTDLALGTTLGDVLVFTGPGRRGDYGNVRIWDLDEERLIRTPEGVNTRDPEAAAAISGHHLLFGRDPRQLGHLSQVVLMDITTGRSKILARSSQGAGPDSINGDWATYTVCDKSTCDVFRYRISTGHARKVPHGPTRSLSSSVVTSNGTVYLTRSSPDACGGDSIVRWTPEGRRTLARFADRFGVGGTDVLVEGRSTTLFFTRATCKSSPGGGTSLTYDVYRLDV